MNFIASTTESRRLYYGDEVDFDMLIIAITDGKVTPDAKVKPFLLIFQFNKMRHYTGLLHSSAQGKYYTLNVHHMPAKESTFIDSDRKQIYQAQPSVSR